MLYVHVVALRNLDARGKQNRQSTVVTVCNLLSRETKHMYVTFCIFNQKFPKFSQNQDIRKIPKYEIIQEF